MQKQKLFLAGGIFLAGLVLGGCNFPGDVKKTDVPQAPTTSQKTDVPKATDAGTVPAAKEELPETVSVQPGATVDQEIKNIDNDLKSIDDASLNTGMTDKELGL